MNGRVLHAVHAPARGPREDRADSLRRAVGREVPLSIPMPAAPTHQNRTATTGPGRHRAGRAPRAGHLIRGETP